MFKDTKSTKQSRLGWRVLLGALWIAGVTGCGARTQEHFDSQSHWLSCEEDAQCGELSCQCAVCTSSCESDADCWALMGGNARCQGTTSLACSSVPSAAKICVPDCADEQCFSSQSEDVSGSSGETTVVVGSPPELVSVPECPAVASMIGLGIYFRTGLTEYEGPATVSEVSQDRILLVPDAVAGQVVEVFAFPAEVAQTLMVGQRFDVSVEVTTEGAAYRALVVRSDAGEPLVVSYSGFDVWYQAGRFGDPSVLGGTLVLRLACQSGVGDACFEAQVQSDYVATFTGDATVDVDAGEYTPVTIGGQAYQVYSWAQGVFGGARLPDCNPDIIQGRSMVFAAYRMPTPASP